MLCFVSRCFCGILFWSYLFPILLIAQFLLLMQIGFGVFFFFSVFVAMFFILLAWWPFGR
ncbi:hypothetical protein L873DRAFT_1936196 [Choiromyces venosus 120613-1]|uniref:Uncharacterized protein n=1 Tax=Choiromyces venosus 120613-1 TaxID=1336337 RepID=A0A3N4J8G6_9PEZI|nr:hypothetical protein L873DRAFT_1936196 [Choiromyces venosus 120613-1]